MATHVPQAGSFMAEISKTAFKEILVSTDGFAANRELLT